MRKIRIETIDEAQEKAALVLLEHKFEKRYVPSDIRLILEFVARGAMVKVPDILAA